MKEHSKCHSAIEECLETGRFSIARLYNEESTFAMHIHSCLEIYYAISGGKQFFIDNRYYQVQPGDVFVINEYESHCLSQVDDASHERIVINIHPNFLAQLSSTQTDLSACFYHREQGFNHRRSLSRDQQLKFLYLTHKMVGTEGFGADVVENAALIELMVLLGALYRTSDLEPSAAEKYQHNALVVQMIDYINQRIDHSITIGDIAGRFYLSPTHVCRLFKAETGTTIARYLSARRISIAKSALAKGCSVAQACEKSGYNNYNHFIRVFTKTVGISPKQYAKQSAT